MLVWNVAWELLSQIPALPSLEESEQLEKLLTSKTPMVQLMQIRYGFVSQGSLARV